MGDLEGLDTLSLALHRLQRLLSSRRVHQRLADAAGVDLPQQAVQVLRALDVAEPMAVADIARTARMDVAAVSRQLRALEERRLVSRRVSPTNASVVLVTATARGVKLAGRLGSVQDRHLRDALADWTSEERGELGELLLRLVDDLQRTPYRTEDS
jgi:DNA-binding MarR family transcriptional regulator